MAIICIFGDSIVQGHIKYPSYGWADLFKRYFEGLDPDKNKAYNLGIPGDMTGWLIERIEVESRARLEDRYKKTNIVILSTGINDTKTFQKGGNPEVNRNSFRGNVSGLISIAKEHADTIYVTGLVPVQNRQLPKVYDGTDIYYSDAISKEYDSLLKEIAVEKKVHFIPIRDIITEEMQDDGLHPNEKGHQEIFKRIKDSIRT